MKIILSLLTIIFCTACKNTEESKPNIEKLNKIPLKTETSNLILKFDDNVLNDIKKNYQTKFGKDESGKKTKFETEVNDSTYNINYRHIPDEEDSEEYRLFSIYIPTKEKAGLIYGDLNNDNLQDLVVTVSLEGGGTGYGNSFADIFVFLNKDKKLTLVNISEYRSVSHCEDGYFWPTKIENGYLVGTSYCYDNGEALCCPSLEYLTKLKLLNNNLVYQSQKKIK